MAASVNVCQPMLAWDAGFPALTVRLELRSKTPCLAHFSKLPFFGMVMPTSEFNSVKIFLDLPVPVFRQERKMPTHVLVPDWDRGLVLILQP